ncbi:MAG: phosphohistidine phosphatase SixA [Verrucomicrobiota bacterium]|jgi:phosphohistidine phosphatase
MNLYLLRHGIAVEPGTPGYEKDSERPLTSEGKSRLRQTAAAMKKMDLRFDLILSSPFLRAKQTAEIIAESLKLKKQPGFSDTLTPDGNPKALVRQLNELKPAPEDVLLVGHEPYLSRLLALLTTGETGMAIDLKKGGLGKLEAESLRLGRYAKLVWLLTPRQMELMA